MAAAALNYFNKSLDELTIAEAAYPGGTAQSAKQLSSNSADTRPPVDRVATGPIGRMLEDGNTSTAQDG